jgi:hypothetical protein
MVHLAARGGNTDSDQQLTLPSGRTLSISPEMFSVWLSHLAKPPIGESATLNRCRYFLDAAESAGLDWRSGMDLFAAGLQETP